MTQQLLNTLYVQTEGSVLRLDHENLLVSVENDVRLRVPLHHLGAIINFGRVSVTSPLLARCAKDGRTIVHLDTQGRFQYRVEGPRSGNVLLRISQHQLLYSQERMVPIVQSIIAGKLYNSRQMLLRCARESDNPNKQMELRNIADEIAKDLRKLSSSYDINSLRGIEGINAKRYFSQFKNRIKVSVLSFTFTQRTRRPPRDPFNALLSFLYMLLLNDSIGAIEGVGLDPQVGFLHTLRPGRASLSLDLIEELRPILADRLALTLVNRQQIKNEHFDFLPGGAVHLNKNGKSIVVIAYQERKKDIVTHPLLKEKMPLGLILHIQARLLARAIRKDQIDYQPFLYK